MAFKTTSYASSSSSQSVAEPKELLLFLSILNEKQKLRNKQLKEQEVQEQQVLQQQQQEHRHVHYQHQHHYHDQQQHKQIQQLQESKWQTEEGEQPGEQRMEWSQIELIYRAEGNANLVLALPQFKKVLRLPKIYKNHQQKQLEQQPQHQETQQYNHKYSQHQQQQKQQQNLQEQQKQQDEMNRQEPNKISTTGQEQSESNAFGILTMDHYVAYISIIRCLVGNEFVFEADIVAVPNPNDRQWINEHIKPYRPANRLDKEFGGHFGLLLPDATQLPAEFDILFSNLQRKTKSATVTTTATKSSQCSNSNSSNSSSSSTDNTRNVCNNIFGTDIFAIEIKPKQGWLLPNDVNNLFDIKPKITQTTTRQTQPPNLSETKIIITTSKASVATAITPTETSAPGLTAQKTFHIATPEKTLKSSAADSERFTTTQNETLQTEAGTTTKEAMNEEAMTNFCYSGINISNLSCTIPSRVDEISHSLYDKLDTRCRYCCMQFLKMKQHKINRRSQYCPIDLFSGNIDRMYFALKSLFECPQNNLRVYTNGNLSFDDEISKTIKIEDLFPSDKLQLIKHLLVTCLLREYDDKGKANVENEKSVINKKSKMQLHTDIATSADVEYSSGVVGWGYVGSSAGVADGQPQSSVTSCKKQKLNTIPETTAVVVTASITRTTTTQTETDVTKVKSTLTSAEEPVFTMDNTSTSTSDCSTRCLEQINKAEVTCLPKNCVLQKILHLQSLAKINLQFMLDHEYADKKGKTYNIVRKLLQKFAENHNELTLCQLSPEEQYILAATVLDCSIMITFCEIENFQEDENEKAKENLIDNTYVVTILGKTFLTKVTLLDLDPKPDAHFNKYCLQTQQISDALKDL